MRSYLCFGLVIGALIAALGGCATPGPTPVPVNPTFVCAGPASVPDFDAVANEVALAAQVGDDGEAMAGIEAVAAAHGGPAVVRCVIDEILPDLRNAPVTGVHLEAWEASR